MAFCSNCGNQTPDGVKFCTSCGATLAAQPAAYPQQTVRQPAAPPVQTVQQPVVTPVNPVQAVYREEPISTGGYVGIMLLLAIPAVNLLCLIIWACGGCSKINKRNFSRAALIWMLIGLVLSGIFYLAGGLVLLDRLNDLKELGTSIINN